MLNYSRLTKFRKFDKKKDFSRIKFCESRKKKKLQKRDFQVKYLYIAIIL